MSEVCNLSRVSWVAWVSWLIPMHQPVNWIPAFQASSIRWRQMVKRMATWSWCPQWGTAQTCRSAEHQRLTCIYSKTTILQSRKKQSSQSVECSIRPLLRRFTQKYLQIRPRTSTCPSWWCAVVAGKRANVNLWTRQNRQFYAEWSNLWRQKKHRHKRPRLDWLISSLWFKG